MRDIERDGVEMSVVDEDATAHWEFWDKYVKNWGRPLMALLDIMLEPEDTLIDIGAWVGPITLWAALSKNRLNVVAIEPDPVAFKQLVENCDYNGLEEQVECIQAAAAVEDGEVQIWPYSEWGRSHSGMTRQRGKPITVEAINMAYVIAENQPDLVKMDIEGGEVLVIPAIGPIMRQLNIPLILAHHPNFYGGNDDNPMRDELMMWVKKGIGTDRMDGKEFLYLPAGNPLPELPESDDEDDWLEDDEED